METIRRNTRKNVSAAVLITVAFILPALLESLRGFGLHWIGGRVLLFLLLLLLTVAIFRELGREFTDSRFTLRGVFVSIFCISAALAVTRLPPVFMGMAIPFLAFGFYRLRRQPLPLSAFRALEFALLESSLWGMTLCVIPYRFRGSDLWEVVPQAIYGGLIAGFVIYLIALMAPLVLTWSDLPDPTGKH
jgi:hypothetical protein